MQAMNAPAVSPQLYQLVVAFLTVTLGIVISAMFLYMRNQRSDSRKLSASINSLTDSMHKLRVMMLEQFVKSEVFKEYETGMREFRHEMRDSMQAMRTGLALLEQKSADWDRRSRSA
jgi:hypothetical protein